MRTTRTVDGCSSTPTRSARGRVRAGEARSSYRIATPAGPRVSRAFESCMIVVSTALTAEGRDTPVFGGGEIFHTIFISSSRTRNIWYGKMLTHLFMENAYIYSFHQFCIPFYLFVGQCFKTALHKFRYIAWRILASLYSTGMRFSSLPGRLG